MKYVLVALPGILLLAVAFIWIPKLSDTHSLITAAKSQNQSPLPTATPSPIATPTPSPSPTPTPSPLTFAQMNALYGPCAYVPTLMYHHVEDMERATAEKHAQLTVGTGTFRTQMQYLKDKGYTVISMGELQQFFDTSTPLPAKPVLLTFDDGYSDFGSDALPILKEYGYHATLFLPTGLTENPGYMTWNTVNDASISKVLIANHTWSHHSVATDKATVEKEITTADTQLAQRGFNNQKVFAYPYGNSNQMAVEVLQKLGYNLAFTTIHGATLCKQQRLVLPRIRIGNSSLAAYGL